MRREDDDQIEFNNDESGYLNWVGRHGEDGFVVNSHRNPASTVTMLHSAACGSISGQHDNYTTNDYFKVCSENVADLHSWARSHGVTLKPCLTCDNRRKKARLPALS